MSFKNPFALLAEDGGSDSESVPLPKQPKPVQVDAAPGKAGPKSGSIPNATTRRNVPGVTTVRPQKEAKELPASDAPAGSQAQFEGERGRDDRGTGFGRGRGRGAPRGEGRGRGGRGGAGGRGGRSERPDRRSATGITDSAKQEHQSWGGDDGKRELEAENDGGADAAAEKTNGTSTPAVVEGTDGAEATPAATTDAAPATPAEPEDNSKTYEEYLKERQAGLNSKLGVPEGRKANEGSDESQWKDGVAITKPETDNYYVGTQKERAAKNKVRKEKNIIEVEFQASPRPERGQRGERGGERGRGGRGRGEGGRGRGEGRGRGAPRGAARGGRPNGAGANFNPDDNSAFPSLS